MSTPVWRKSSRSGTGGLGGQECVEVADLAGDGIGVRDSTAPESGHLTLSGDVFAALVTRVKRDELTL